MTSRQFTQVDVFCSSRGRGNPLAVVHDGSGLSDAEMQAFAHWTNVSETTFVLPPTTAEADYKVRIFTPAEELRVRRPSDARHVPRLARGRWHAE